MYVSVLPLLTQVEYIRIKRKDLAARPTELVGYLRQIPSQSLKYLAIHTMEEIDSGINQPILGSVFGELPSVRMIDVRGTRWTSLSMTFETIRYTRTGLPRTVNIPAWMLFGWWWLCVQDDLEAIDPA
ncbi:hypothetical protein ONZ45_g9855 [Pleurotus djamor]|nr:hypothetical protein ONZ45_g9855 [Pleurotus djamor]